jgi:hypothetical protein
MTPAGSTDQEFRGVMGSCEQRFLLREAFAQASPQQVHLLQVGCVDPEPKR